MEVQIYHLEKSFVVIGHNLDAHKEKKVQGNIKDLGILKN